ncbi:MAG: WbqC family protein [Bacteroidia bacterium]
MITSKQIILPSFYLAPVQWYSKLFQASEIIVEQHEHYVKQTWRNRTRIVGANGIQDLIIPVHAPNHTRMCDVKINYEEAWQRQHWQSIRSAYGNSPFFNFYADHFSPFYEKKEHSLLLNYTTELLKLTLKLLKLDKKIILTETFSAPENKMDFRLLISPKVPIEKDPAFHPKRYLQVFEERHEFIPNLSIIDLLCCVGPASGGILIA